MGKRRPSRTVFQPDQADLFAKVRARFADLGAIGTLSVIVIVSTTIAVFTILFSTNEDFWLRPALLKVRYPLLGLFVLAVAAEFIRSLQLFHHKDGFVAAHFIALTGTFVLFVWLSLQSDTIADTRARWKANEAQRRVAAEAMAKAAAEECQAQRTQEIDRATKKQADMRALVRRCKQEFENAKAIFTSDTVEKHCKARSVSLAIAVRGLQEAAARSCPSGKSP